MEGEKFDFVQTFIDDCIEVKGYTKKEAEILYHQKGGEFIEEMLNDLWTNWSENFPIKVKGEDDV